MNPLKNRVMITIEELKRNISKLSRWERGNPLFIIEGHAYSPNQILAEIEKETEIGMKAKSSILTNVINSSGITSDTMIRELAKIRLRKLFTERPVIIRTLLLNKPEMTSREILQQIEIEESTLGQSFIDTEITRIYRLYRILRLK